MAWQPMRLGDRLLALSEGRYLPLSSAALNHGGRLAKTLQEGEEPIFAAWCHKPDFCDDGCGIVLSDRRLFLLPINDYHRVGQVLTGAVTGKGPVIDLRFAQIGALQTYGSGEENGTWKQLRTGYASQSHLLLRLSTGEQVKLESIIPATAPAALLAKLRAIRAFG
jgi:hypothetical protein